MNNLLRSLTDSHLAQEPDLKLLLNSVKEARRQCHDTKLSDAFYDSLDGLLQDVRQVTMDNRDAEAFLKPVSKSEVPDYYEVIMHPMDLQTMQKKVKQKAYKSKREFKDDLDLIWSNCFSYNATENHPLRQCATRLKAKAEKLLKNITDRRERLDPPVPSDASRGGTPKLNGTVNGHAVVRSRSVAFTKSPSPSKPVGVATARRDAQFPDQPAIVRTTEGMVEWLQLDKELDARLNGELLANGFSGPSVEERLRQYVGLGPEGHDEDRASMDGEVGEKRKLSPGESGPRKRPRTGSTEKDAVDLWWDAMQSDFMIGHGLPVLAHVISEEPAAVVPPTGIVDPPRKASQRPRKKRRKQADERMQKTLLYRMNDNVRTLRRVRDVHARLTVLKETADDPTSGEPSLLLPPVDDIEDPIDDQPWSIQASGDDIGEEHADDCMHWMSSKVLEHAGFQGTSKVALDVLAGVASDYLLNVGRTIQFLTEKYGHKMTPEEIILHTLFEGGVTRAPYDLDRYIKEDIVRYGSRMNDLEKKLSHVYSEATAEQAWDDEALFGAEENEEEDGEFVMGNFADAFGEDFLGLRELGIAAEFGLSSLSVPKKLLKSKNKGAAQGAPSAKKPSEPPPPFPPPPPFILLDSKTAEDQIGLLKSFYQHRIAQISVPVSPPAPPPMPPFNTTLPGASAPPRPFPQAPYPPPSVSLSPTLASTSAAVPAPELPEAPSPPPVTLPDDAPAQAHTKLGPLGQVLKPSAAASAAKKKDKAPAKGKGPAEGPGPGAGTGGASGSGAGGGAAGGAGAGGVGDTMVDGTPAATPVATAPETPKKPKPTPTKKKKQPPQPSHSLEVLPPPILASG